MTAAEIAEIAKYAELSNQRFGQFVCNAVSVTFSGLYADLFYIPDGDLLIAARSYYNNYIAVMVNE